MKRNFVMLFFALLMMLSVVACSQNEDAKSESVDDFQASVSQENTSIDADEIKDSGSKEYDSVTSENDEKKYIGDEQEDDLQDAIQGDVAEKIDIDSQHDGGVYENETDALRAVVEEYYSNTVFEVLTLEVKSQTQNSIIFTVHCKKDSKVEPDRMIELSLDGEDWKVINEGY